MNFSLWILFVLDYLLLEITTPLMFTSDVVMETRASSDLNFIGMWNISFIITWPLHNQSYCNISMKNGSNVIIQKWGNDNTVASAFNCQQKTYGELAFERSDFKQIGATERYDEKPNMSTFCSIVQCASLNKIWWLMNKHSTFA